MPRTNNSLSLQQRLEILDYCKEHVDNGILKQRDVAKKFSISQPTISRLRRKEPELRKQAAEGQNLAVKRQRQVKFPAVEQMLATWLAQAEADGLAISGELIRAQWRWFAVEEDIEQQDWPKLSEGWLTAFKRQYGLKRFRLHGEAGSVDKDAVVTAREHFHTITKGFALCNIFNMDETGLFGKMPPNCTLATKQASGRKSEKHRLSYAFTVNADGSEKLEPLVIGRYRRPHCFLNKDGTEYGYRYFWNKKAWMKAGIFQQYLENLDREMRRQDRHILLLLDNFSEHKYNEARITNSRVKFFPPNMTSHVQLLDQGIICCFKARYCRLFCERAVMWQVIGIAPSDLYRINQLEIMALAKDAWDEVSPSKISNCWRRSGIIQYPRDTAGLLLGPDEPILFEPEVPDMVRDPEHIAVTRELQDMLSTLQEGGVGAPVDAMSTEELLNVQEERVGHQQWMDREILEQVRAELREEEGEIEEEEEEEEEPEAPLWSD